MGVHVIPERNINGAVINHSSPFSESILPDGNVLYTKIHGMKADIPAGQTHNFDFPIPYAEVYFQGAEILEDIVGVNDFTIEHPQAGTLEQYGYTVNMGTIKYEREAQYAAKLPMGLILRCAVKNDTDATKEFGVNYLLHEIRNPNV